MDISKITDATELKSMAYDQMLVIDQAQANLRMIQQRLAQLQQETQKKSEKSKKDKDKAE